MQGGEGSSIGSAWWLEHRSREWPRKEQKAARSRRCRAWEPRGHKDKPLMVFMQETCKIRLNTVEQWDAKSVAQ